MVEIFKVVGKVARTRASVLIYGETGTGKELVARAIPDSSDRGSRPFVAINCSALPDALFESELFGHIQGAFTNANKLRRGLIEESSGGTLFLDEISDLSPAGQIKLLRVLQEGEITVDLRIVAASRYDLQQLVKEGRFREDLLYRLKTVTITIPPLRERREEIPLLADLFLARYSIDGNATVLLPSALDVLIKYDWPGNVRELEHIIERAATLARRRAMNRQLVAEIRVIHAASRQTYGSPRVHAVLQGQGQRVGAHRVALLMRASAIRAKTVKTWRATTESAPTHPIAPTTLNRQFTVAEPNRVWAGDITYV